MYRSPSAQTFIQSINQTQGFRRRTPFPPPPPLPVFRRLL